MRTPIKAVSIDGRTLRNTIGALRLTPHGNNQKTVEQARARSDSRERGVSVKTIPVLLLGSALLMSWPASAGPLYGTLLIAGAPVAGVTISVSCPTFQAATQGSAQAITDAGGSYAMRVPANGRCQMRVERNGQAGTAFDVFVSDNALRFDFQVDAALNRTS